MAMPSVLLSVGEEYDQIASIFTEFKRNATDDIHGYKGLLKEMDRALFKLAGKTGESMGKLENFAGKC